MTRPRPLAAGFPVFTEADWRAALARTRAGGTGPERESAVIVHPRRAWAHAIVGRPLGVPWQIVQRVDADAGPVAAVAIAADIGNGATGAEISFAGSMHPLARGLPAGAAAAVAKALMGTPNRFHLRIDGADPATESIFLDVAAKRHAELVLARDPIAALAINGKGEVDGARIEASAKAFDLKRVKGAVVIADGRMWNAGGATEEQELAATLATFVAMLRLLDAPERIAVALAADADQFRGIAKLRAMRLLLARIGEVAGLTLAPHIHVETAWRVLSARDPEMNILRGTTAAFAAAVGGANSITVLPFDVLATKINSQGRRLARNTQVILAEEAHLFRVADPAAGSGAIEALTDSLAETAWKRFQRIEAAGGVVAAITEGSLLRDVAEAREARIASAASGETKIVGVNAYAEGQTAPANVRRMPAGPSARLVFNRVAEIFEAGAG